jgi:hypothetical protein
VESSTVVDAGEAPTFLSHLLLEGDDGDTREFMLVLAPTGYAPRRARHVLDGGIPLALGMRVVNPVTGQSGEVVRELPKGEWQVTLDGEEGFMHVRPRDVVEETAEHVREREKRGR